MKIVCNCSPDFSFVELLTEFHISVFIYCYKPTTPTESFRKYSLSCQSRRDCTFVILKNQDYSELQRSSPAKRIFAELLLLFCE